MRRCGLCDFEGEGDAFARHMAGAHGWDRISTQHSAPSSAADTIVASALAGMAFFAFAASGSFGFSYPAFGPNTGLPFAVLFVVALVGAVFFAARRPIGQLLRRRH